MIPFTKLTEEQLQKCMLHGSGALAQGYNELVDAYEQQQKRISELEQFNLEAIKLLDAAICPCCDKSGAYYDNNGEVCQCQWCDEVNRLPQPPKEQGHE